MIDPKNREKFERTGVDAIRAAVANNHFFEGSTPADQSKEWLRELDKVKDARNAEQQRMTMYWAKLGAWAAIIAAVASVLALFIKGH